MLDSVREWLEDTVVRRHRFLSWLYDQAGVELFTISAYSIVSGTLQGLVVVFINGAAAHTQADFVNFKYLLLFLLCMAAFMYCNILAVGRAVELLGNAIFKTRQRLVDKLRNAEVLKIEGIEISSVYKAIIEHTELFFEASRTITYALSGTVMVIASMIYIGVLSFEAFLIAVGLNFAGVFLYVTRQSKISERFSQSRSEEIDFLKYFDHILNGFYETKISRARSDDLFENYVVDRLERAEAHAVETEKQINGNLLFGQAFFYVTMGAIVFILPRLTTIETAVVIQTVAIVLFIMGPLGEVIRAVPVLSKAQYAVEDIEKLEAYLDAANDMRALDLLDPLAERDEIEEIKLSGVEFRYSHADLKRTFLLGPIDLSIRKNEVIFLVGGNGSGKSTLLKLIAGLYYPEGGGIAVDGIALTPANYQIYRDRFAMISTRFHLFDRLYGMASVDEQLLESLLRQVQLHRVVRYEDGRFTNLNLSSGQRKRLAMATTYVEDKPLYVFDEVAADLDPEFRQFFYEEFLRTLKKRGKTVVAVSHDDRYFHLADRILKLEDGQIVDRGI